MRDPLFEPKAAKQTVSITLNSDLYAKAKRIGINTSRLPKKRSRRSMRSDVPKLSSANCAQVLAPSRAMPSNMDRLRNLVREHYERDDGAV